LLVAIPSGCARSSGRSEAEPVLAAASIGPAGGALVVDAGDYAGLQLLVPPGAIRTDTEVRLVAVFEPQPMLVTLPTASQVFRIEPESLVLLAPATLRVPYFAPNGSTTRRRATSWYARRSVVSPSIARRCSWISQRAAW
jgi:hypothetical protein